MADRKFAEWRWCAKENPRAEDVHITVRYKWGQKDAYDPERIDRGTLPTFYLKVHEPIFVELESGDLRWMAEEIDRLLTEYFQIDWEPYLLVEVSLWDGESHGTRFTLTEYEGGEWEGEPIFRKESARGRGHNYIKGGPKEVVERETPAYHSSNKQVRGMVRDTPENRRALGEIQMILTKMGTRLCEMFQGDQAADTLADFTLRMLTAPALEGE